MLRLTLASALAFRLCFLIALPYSLFVLVQADVTGISCFGYDGVAYANNSVCPNSEACCGVAATCLSNRLCHNPGDGDNTFVRGPCAVDGWDSQCAQICLYDETTGILPRVTPCSDGSLCCNNDPQCCSNGDGIFLDSSGNVVSSSVSAVYTSYPPSGNGTSRYTETPSTSSTATSSSTSATETSSSVTTAGASSAAAASSTAAQTSFANTQSSSSNDVALKAGLGAGIPCGVALIAGLVYFAIRARRRRANLDQYAAPALEPKDNGTTQPVYEAGPGAAYEVGTGASYYDAPPVELNADPHAAELHSYARPHHSELP